MKRRVHKLVVAVSALSGLAGAAPCLGQWQFQGTSIYYNGGFVGVGTSAPTTSAEVFGILGNTSGYAGMYARTTGGSGLPFYGYKAGGGSVAWHYLNGGTGTWNLWNGGTDRLSVTSAGSVGIGTTAPMFRLDVAGTARARADGGTGDGLMLGGASFPMGLTTEIGGANTLLNLDLNFRGTGRSNAFAGGAVRLDARSGQPTIQFLTRPAGSGTESLAMGIAPDGRVGIGTSSPQFPLHVIAPGMSAAVVGDGWTAGIAGVNHIPSQTQNIEGYAEAGVVGRAMADSGDTAGVWGATRSPTGTGVVGRGDVVGATGVRGLAMGPACVGVYGEGNNFILNAQPGSPIGVFGKAITYYSITPIGVKGSAGYFGYGVYAEGNSGASGTKSFRIDHPDDPTGKYLLHYCAEGPEPQNVYNGVATLDGRGSARVTLPAYFSKINKEPRYSLTAIGAPMPMLHIAAKIDAAAEASEFVINGGVAGGEVSWEVKAVRNDLWVRTVGAPVEVEKQGAERGTYQHPALYGQAEEAPLPARAPGRAASGQGR